MKRETKRTIVEAGCPFFSRNAPGAAIMLLLIVAFCLTAANAEVTWQRKSSSTGDMPIPNNGKEQTCCLILDIDKDGVDDFVVGERMQTPYVVWYKYNEKSWDKFVIDDTRKNPEAGGDYCDIDDDGNLDIFIGEMGNPGASDNARIYIWYGDGDGNFKDTVASHGQGIHEGKRRPGSRRRP